MFGVMNSEMKLTILSGKLLKTAFSAAQYPASLPIPVISSNMTRANNVPPPAGLVLVCEPSYTDLIPKYPERRQIQARARESRGPVESASFPRKGADAYSPTAGDQRTHLMIHKE